MLLLVEDGGERLVQLGLVKLTVTPVLLRIVVESIDLALARIGIFLVELRLGRRFIIVSLPLNQ